MVGVSDIDDTGGGGGEAGSSVLNASSSSPVSSPSSLPFHARASRGARMKTRMVRTRRKEDEDEDDTVMEDDSAASTFTSIKSRGKRKMEECSSTITTPDESINVISDTSDNRNNTVFDATSMHATTATRGEEEEEDMNRTRIRRKGRSDKEGGDNTDTSHMHGEHRLMPSLPTAGPSSDPVPPPPSSLLPSSRRRSSRLLAAASASASAKRQPIPVKAEAAVAYPPWNMGAVDGARGTAQTTFTFDQHSPYSIIEAERAVRLSSSSSSAAVATVPPRTPLQDDDPTLINLFEIHPAPFLFGLECHPRIYGSCSPSSSGTTPIVSRRTASLPSRSRKSSPTSSNSSSSKSASASASGSGSGSSTSLTSNSSVPTIPDAQQHTPNTNITNISTPPSRPKLLHSRSHATSLSVADLGLNKWIAAASASSTPTEGAPPLVSAPILSNTNAFTASPPTSPTQSSATSSSSASNQFSSQDGTGSTASSTSSNTSNTNTHTTPPSPGGSHCSSSSSSCGTNSSSSSSSAAFKRASDHYMLDTLRLKKRKLSHRIRSFLLLRPPGPPRIGVDGAADIQSIVRAPAWLKNATSQLSRESRMAPEEWFWSGDEADASTWTVTLLEKQFSSQLRLASDSSLNSVLDSSNSNSNSAVSSANASLHSSRAPSLHALGDIATVFTRQGEASSKYPDTDTNMDVHDGGEGHESQDDGNNDDSETSTVLGEIRITTTPPRKRQSSAPPAMEANPDQLQQRGQGDTLIATFIPKEQSGEAMTISDSDSGRHKAGKGHSHGKSHSVGNAQSGGSYFAESGKSTGLAYAGDVAVQHAPPPEVLKSQLLAVLRSRLPEGGKNADAPLRMKKFVVWNAWVRRATVPNPRLRYRRTTSPEASDKTKGPVLASPTKRSPSPPRASGDAPEQVHGESRSQTASLASPVPIAIPNQSQSLVDSHIDGKYAEQGQALSDQQEQHQQTPMLAAKSFDEDDNYDPFTIFDDDEDDDDIFNEVEQALHIHLGSSEDNTSYTARRFSNAFTDGSMGEDSEVSGESNGYQRSSAGGPFLGAGKLVDSHASSPQSTRQVYSSSPLLLSPQPIPSALSSSPPAGMQPDLPDGPYHSHSSVERPRAPLRARLENGTSVDPSSINHIIHGSSSLSSMSFDTQQSTSSTFADGDGDGDGPITPYWLEEEQFASAQLDIDNSATRPVSLPGAIVDGRYSAFHPQQNDSSPSLSPSDRKSMAAYTASRDRDQSFAFQSAMEAVDDESQDIAST